MKIEHILIDMDGVLTDFVGHFMRTFDFKMPSPWPKGEFFMSKLLGISEEHMWNLIAEKSPAYWADMPPTHFATELLLIVSRLGVPFTISTSPSRDPQCAAGKILWMHKHLGPTFKDFMIGHNKVLMARPGVVLIDDYEKNNLAFAKAGGRVCPIPRPWNPYEGEPLLYVKNRLVYYET